MRPIRFDADAECAAKHPEPVLEDTVVAKDGRLANVVVWASRGAERWRHIVPSAPVDLWLVDCLCRPHVLTLQVGQPLRVSTTDPQHHFLSFGAINPESAGVVQPGKPLFTRFQHEEVGIRLKGCHVHGWMLARAAALPHPFHGVTDHEGLAAIRLPPGEYGISAWHEYEKFARPAPQAVTVEAGETKNLEFVFEVR